MKRAIILAVSAVVVSLGLGAVDGAHAVDDSQPLQVVRTKAADWRPVVKAARADRNYRLKRCHHRKACKARARADFRRMVRLAKAPASWRRDDTLARWDPCRPLTWSTTAGPAARESVLRAAFREVGAAAGITFQKMPWPEDADIVIQWSDNLMTHEALGEAYIDEIDPKPDGKIKAVHATITMRPDANYKTLLMHEIGHVLGLGHVNDQRQVMNEASQWWPMRIAGPRLEHLQSGDKAGLWAVGRGGGCFSY